MMLNASRRKMLVVSDAATAGQTYRPDSARESIVFCNRWFCHCAKSDDDGPCEIFALATLFREDEPEYPKELIHGADGQPECTAFKEVR